MNKMLTLAQVLLLHTAALQAFGGAPGMHERGALDSALAEPLQTFDGQDL
jgi:death-on-curing protein